MPGLIARRWPPGQYNPNHFPNPPIECVSDLPHLGPFESYMHRIACMLNIEYYNKIAKHENTLHSAIRPNMTWQNKSYKNNHHIKYNHTIDIWWSICMVQTRILEYGLYTTICNYVACAHNVFFLLNGVTIMESPMVAHGCSWRKMNAKDPGSRLKAQ